MVTHPKRHLSLAGAHNIRDLGGYDLRDGRQTRWRSLVRADALHNLTVDAQADVIRYGVRTVVDLRNDAELSAAPNPFREHEEVAYHNISLFDALSPIQMAHDPGESPFDMSARYCAALDRCQPAIAQVMGVIAEAEGGAVLFHCSAGKDRTGIVAALLLCTAGVGEEVVIADYALTETVAAPLLERLRAQAVARGTPPDLVDKYLACKPNLMRKALNHLNGQYGGVRAYLAQIGIGNAVLRRIENRLSAD